MAQKEKKAIVGELVFGIHSVVEVLRAKKRKVISIYTTKPEPKSWDDISKLMPAYHVPIQYVSRDVLTRMADSSDHQGVIAWAQSPQQKISLNQRIIFSYILHFKACPFSAHFSQTHR